MSVVTIELTGGQLTYENLSELILNSAFKEKIKPIVLTDYQLNETATISVVSMCRYSAITHTRKKC